jgi:hypothetical protein
VPGSISDFTNHTPRLASHITAKAGMRQGLFETPPTDLVCRIKLRRAAPIGYHCRTLWKPDHRLAVHAEPAPDRTGIHVRWRSCRVQ